MRCLFAAVLAFMLSLPVAAQDSAKAAQAWLRGDYTTALREWRPLAEQGYAVAQYFLGVATIGHNCRSGLRSKMPSVGTNSRGHSTARS